MRTNYFISFLILTLIISNYNEIICQNDVNVKDTLTNKKKYILSISIVSSPLFHSINIYYNKDISSSFQSGINVSVKFGEKSGGGLTSGISYDYKNYVFKHYLYTYPVISGNYKYLYIPILFNYYFKSTCISFGAVRRIPISSKMSSKEIENNIDNPKGGFRMGVGKIVSLKNKKLNIQFEPYFIFTIGNSYGGAWEEFLGTESLGLLFGFDFKISYNLIKF